MWLNIVVYGLIHRTMYELWFFYECFIVCQTYYVDYIDSMIKQS